MSARDLLPAPEHDLPFRAMGCDLRLLVGPPLDPSALSAAEAAADARAWLEGYDRRLSRFRAGSELSALNADPRAVVPASPLLRVAVAAGRWAAERSGGLVDPALLGALERAGYARPWAAMADERLPLEHALACAPARGPARPAPAAYWRALEIDDTTGAVARPPGLRLDLGGTGKGLAADAVAVRLAGHARVAVDCGGDLRIAGPGAAARPYEVPVEHPLSGEHVHVLLVGSGGVATSGLGRRIWRPLDGTPRHHLLDPATGEPAWTGLIQATALAPTALEAETLAKMALLSGPDAGRRLLRDAHGGVLVRDDGDVEVCAAAAADAPRPRIRLPLPAARA